MRKELTLFTPTHATVEMCSEGLCKSGLDPSGPFCDEVHDSELLSVNVVDVSHCLVTVPCSELGQVRWVILTGQVSYTRAVL